MGVVRTVGIPGHVNGETKQTTNLKEGLKYVKTKVHEMVKIPQLKLDRIVLNCAWLDIQWSEDRPMRNHIVWF